MSFFCIDSQDGVGDAVGRELVESDDIFILGLLILSLFIRRESLSLLGLLTHLMPLVSNHRLSNVFRGYRRRPMARNGLINVPFFNNLSTLSCKRSLVMSLKIGVFLTYICILLISARLRSF